MGMNDLQVHEAPQDGLLAEIAELLFRLDPVGLAACGAPADEYVPEAGTIAPKLVQTSSVEDVHAVVFAEFLFWFGSDAGTFEQYRGVAEAIWERLPRRSDQC